MKLFRFGLPGKEQPGVVDDAGSAWDVSAMVKDYNEEFFEGPFGIAGLRAEIERGIPGLVPVDLTSVRLGPPVARPSKMLGIGLNYKDHARETGARVPSEPKIFMKATTCLCGVTDDVVLPPGSQHLDYEVELAFVVGRVAKYVRPDSALDYVLGYTVCNDFSEREYQKNREGQFVKGKSADTFGPLGPFLVLGRHEEFLDAHLWCKVNGETRQDSSTKELVFGVRELIVSLSQYMTLLPGDVVTTGTPSGVGLGMNPPVFLRAGDVVEYGVSGIGAGRQVITE